MVDGGNILFFGCGGAGSNRAGAVSDSLGELYYQRGKTVNMFFNNNQSCSVSDYIGYEKYKRIYWNKGLTLAGNPNWLFVQSTKTNGSLKKLRLSNDIAIKKQSNFDTPPYYDVIYPI